MSRYRRNNRTSNLEVFAIVIAIFWILSLIVRVIEFFANNVELLISILIIIILIIIFIVNRKTHFLNNVCDDIFSSIYKKKIIYIRENSRKIKKIKELNEKMLFEKLNGPTRLLVENTYSMSRDYYYDKKNYDRIKPEYVIENNFNTNENGILSLVENAINNYNLYQTYKKEIEKIDEEVTYTELNKLNMLKSTYLKIENKIIDEIIIKDDIYDINFKVDIVNKNKYAKNNNSKNANFDFFEIRSIYNEWKKSNDYKTNVEFERKVMNDKLRYEVLKRDNFRCVKCGAKASDGVSLHVDHIVPVARGGKTMMSNLQTLCDRCNLGKGTDEN